MSPKLQRQRPDSESHLVRRPEPIRTGSAEPAAQPDPAAAATAPQAAAARPGRARNGGVKVNRPARQAARRSGADASQSKPGRPTAQDLVAPVRQTIAREALKADVPADLALLQRLRRYRLDNGVDIRDQVAIAVDEWLRGQGY